jgi:1-acyl-sn-glycerol-3-phosphate acyltransferase
VSWPLYLLVRAILVPLFRVCLRLEGIGGEDMPRSGPLLLASNHRSFLDPFVIGALMKRPVYYVAKRELFQRRWQASLLAALGAFPIDRGSGDQEAMATAKAILQRGDCVVIFPEGTRVRRGPLRAPRRGVGRLALETGATVMPIAVIGTDKVRDGWRLRPQKVKVRFGRCAVYCCAAEVSPSLAAGVTGRIWACVALQWEWLGGEVPPRQGRMQTRSADAMRPRVAHRA